MSDWLAVVISFVYVFAVLGMAELLRKSLHYSPDFTRKVVHIGVGMWAIGTVLLFQNSWMAIIPPASFILLNYISYRRDMFKSMEGSDKTNLGTVYFPLAFCLIILFFWGRPNLAVAALMPMTWGDAMASVLGRQFGRIQYKVLGHTRTVEGSVSMALFSLISTLLALWLLPPGMVILPAAGIALLVAVAATGVEAVSPWGIDNLTVPLISSLILSFF